MKHIFLFLSILSLNACWFLKPDDLGLKNKSLKPCPSSPNCVSTFAKTEYHRIKPIVYEAEEKEIMMKILSAIKSQSRTEIIKQNENYVLAEFTTKIMRYVDDVEFYIDTENKTLHFRSASRIGYGDGGLNRKRMEKLRDLIEEKP